MNIKTFLLSVKWISVKKPPGIKIYLSNVTFIFMVSCVICPDCVVSFISYDCSYLCRVRSCEYDCVWRFLPKCQTRLQHCLKHKLIGQLIDWYYQLVILYLTFNQPTMFKTKFSHFDRNWGQQRKLSDALTHLTRQWSPWHSSRSSGRTLYGKQNQVPPAWSLPQSRKSQ